jgi:hypothetical protein
MAFALHTNTDVQIAHRAGTTMPLLLGSFREADRGHLFEYAARPDRTFAPAGFAPECPHIVYVNESYRFARVLKTVAWVCVDEDENGEPVMERWDIRQHRHYDTGWVFQS